MMLFHRFLDLTDELFIDAGAREGGERVLKGKRQRKLKMDPARIREGFFFSPH